MSGAGTPATDPANRFEELVAEMNNVVGVIAGYAEVLAAQHDPGLVADVRGATDRYRRIVVQLRRSYDEAAQRGGP